MNSRFPFLNTTQVMIVATCLLLCNGTAIAAQDAAHEPCPPQDGRTGDVQKPELVVDVEPTYSKAALDARIQGVVILQTVVKADGTVSDIEVLKGLPMGLSERAIEVVRQRRFKPAQFCGKPVDVYYNQTIHFELPPLPSSTLPTALGDVVTQDGWKTKVLYTSLVVLLIFAVIACAIAAHRLARALAQQ